MGSTSSSNNANGEKKAKDKYMKLDEDLTQDNEEFINNRMQEQQVRPTFFSPPLASTTPLSQFPSFFLLPTSLHLADMVDDHERTRS